MNLKTYLASMDMSIKDFSELMEVSANYMSRIINGHSKPSKRLARDIEKATDGLIKLVFSSKENA